MTKDEAIRLLGGTPTEAARAIGIASQALYGWPDELPPRIADRVWAAIARRRLGEDALVKIAERGLEQDKASHE
jgi:hypothetical protein